MVFFWNVTEYSSFGWSLVPLFPQEIKGGKVVEKTLYQFMGCYKSHDSNSILQM